MEKPLFGTPVGPSKMGQHTGGFWCTAHSSTDGPILCEMCGTEHPAREDKPYVMSRLFGLQVVDECCGAILDIAYRELAEVFAIRLLGEFANNPSDSAHHILLVTIKRSLIAARKKLIETSQTVAEISEAENALGR